MANMILRRGIVELDGSLGCRRRRENVPCLRIIPIECQFEAGYYVNHRLAAWALISLHRLCSPQLRFQVLMLSDPAGVLETPRSSRQAMSEHSSAAPRNAPNVSITVLPH